MAAHRPVAGGEVAAGGQGVGVFGSQDTFPGGQGLLVQGDRVLVAAHRPVADGEVAAGGQGVGVLGSQDTFPAGQGLLVQGDRVLAAHPW